MKVNENAIAHQILAGLSVIGIIVLQILGKGSPDVYALLGAVVGFSGQSATIHTLFDEGVDDEDDKKGETK